MANKSNKNNDEKSNKSFTWCNLYRKRSDKKGVHGKKGFYVKAWWDLGHTGMSFEAFQTEQQHLEGKKKNDRGFMFFPVTIIVHRLFQRPEVFYGYAGVEDHKVRCPDFNVIFDHEANNNNGRVYFTKNPN